MSIKWPSIIYINPVMRTGIYLEILTDKYIIHHNPLRNAHTGRIKKPSFPNHKMGCKERPFSVYIKIQALIKRRLSMDTLIPDRPQTP